MDVKDIACVIEIDDAFSLSSDWLSMVIGTHFVFHKRIQTSFYSVDRSEIVCFYAMLSFY